MFEGLHARNEIERLDAAGRAAVGRVLGPTAFPCSQFTWRRRGK